MEIYKNDYSKYSIATMKTDLKDALDYLTTIDEIYIPKLNRNVKLKTLTMEEQLALEERIQEVLIYRLNNVIDNMETSQHL